MMRDVGVKTRDMGVKTRHEGVKSQGAPSQRAVGTLRSPLGGMQAAETSFSGGCSPGGPTEAVGTEAEGRGKQRRGPRAAVTWQ